MGESAWREHRDDRPAGGQPAARRGARLPAWAPLFVALLVAVSALLAVDLVYRVADGQQAGLLALARAEGAAQRSRALQLGIAADERSAGVGPNDLRAAFAEVRGALHEVDSRSGEQPELRAVRDALDADEAATARLLALLADGRADEARRWDAAEVAPRHAALLATLDRAIPRYEALARAAKRRADLAGNGIGVATLILLAALAWRIARAQRATAPLAAEQEALRRSEERFRALVQRSSDVITVLDRDGVISYQSPSVARVLGRAPEAATGRDAFASIHPDDLARVRDLFAACRAEPGASRAAEFRLRHSDGGWRRMEAIGTNLLDDAAVAGIVVNLRDITERVAAEADLRRQSDRLLALHDAALAIASEPDPEAVLRGTLQRAVELLGAGSGSLYRWDEAAGLLRCIHNWQVPASDTTPDQAPGQGLAGYAFVTRAPLIVNDYLAWAGAMASGRRAGLRAAVAAPLVRAGRTLGVVVIRSYDATDRFGDDDARLLALFADQAATAIENAEHLAAARRELAERERAEAALRRSEASLADAQALAHLGSWEVDVQTSAMRWSDEVFRIHGHPPQGFAPTYAALLAAIHPDDRDQFEVVGAAGLAPGGGPAVEVRIVRPDGEVRVVQSQTTVRADADGGGLRVVGTMLDVTERKALERQLVHQAFHDPLTDLPNRVLFLDRLAQVLAGGRRSGRGAAVLFLDLDGFKVVNDSLGHQSGDALLVAVATRLRGAIRPGDTVARFGGDEFAILLEDARDEGDVARTADRLLQLLAAPFPVGGQDLFVGASIGIARDATGAESPEELLRHADIALYRAKGRGKGRYESFDPRMSAEAQDRLALERDLRRAIERGDFALHYQPLVALATGELLGLEALVRWPHPERGIIPPGAFIPLAEETGLILPLGRWVLEEACRQVQRWRALMPDGAAPLVSVNLSARQFQGPDLVADVARALARSGLAPGRLQLEITETAVMGDATVTIATLRELKGLGVRLAIDDFGTGYSSLAYLKRFPVDALKIDQAFVAGLGRDPEDEAIVGAVIALGRALGLAVAAEGIEGPAQLRYLRALGCEVGQGYYFARPLAPEAAAQLVARGRVAADLPPLPIGHRPALAGVRRIGAGD